jgi:RNA polymerase sigma factor (TIGR02999 family)
MAEIQFNSEQPGRTLQPTALVHETFLRLLKTGPKKFLNRAHFFGVAARAMRRILVEQARRRASGKRGGGWERIPLEDVQLSSQAPPDYLAIDSALKRLRRFDENLCKLMELRIFAGLTACETAEVLRIGESTVRKRRCIAEAWLKREIQEQSQLISKLADHGQQTRHGDTQRPQLSVNRPGKGKEVKIPVHTAMQNQP